MNPVARPRPAVGSIATRRKAAAASQLSRATYGPSFRTASLPTSSRSRFKPALRASARRPDRSRRRGAGPCVAREPFSGVWWDGADPAQHSMPIGSTDGSIGFSHGCDAVKPVVRICPPCSLWRTGQTFTGNQANRVRPDRRAIWSFRRNPLKPQQVLGCLAEALFLDGCWFARSDWLCRD